MTLNKYLEQNNHSSKYLSMDSTFVPNKYGEEELGRNVFYKSKIERKITVIVDEKEVPLKINVTKGNTHDAKIAPKII